MTTQELQEKINLYQRVMDGCGKPENHFSLVDAIKGKKPSEEYLAFEKLVETAGLSEGFFSNADPLFPRAKRERDKYQKRLEEKRLLQNGISVA